MRPVDNQLPVREKIIIDLAIRSVESSGNRSPWKFGGSGDTTIPARPIGREGV